MKTANKVQKKAEFSEARVKTTCFNNSLPGFIEVDEIHTEFGKATLYQRFSECSGFEAYWSAKITIDSDAECALDTHCYSVRDLEHLKETVLKVFASCVWKVRKIECIEYNNEEIVGVSLDKISPFPELNI